jgi:molecular chaperone HtpG
LQSDANVKKISNHITKKVADRLQEIFSSDRKQFEEKWDNLKIFIEYGMLSDEKFYDKAQKFALFKNIDGNYYTFDEYRQLIKGEQKDKDGQLIYLYTTNKDEQYSYIDAAKSKGYDVLLMDGQLDIHYVGQLEQKFEKSRFLRIDSDVIDNLIAKDKQNKPTLPDAAREELQEVFKSQIPKLEKTDFLVGFEPLGENATPVLITQNEFMRRMREMSTFQTGFSFYGEMPDSYTLIVNIDHPLVKRILADEESNCSERLSPIRAEVDTLNKRQSELNVAHKGKKDEEIPVAEKEELKDIENKLVESRNNQNAILSEYAAGNPLVHQLIDLALLSNSMLKGEALSNFIKRSVAMI